jgi:2-polyprenyl-3-methyl-5-hydroxy-6-metoxy-1,4-benzoquinol methylase
MIRKIKIWAKGSQKINTFKINCGNYDKFYTVNNVDHQEIIVPVSDNNHVVVLCTQGTVSIGSIEINYSWIMNPYFQKQYTEDVKQLLTHNFDLSYCSSQFKKELNTTNFWIDSGPNGYAANENLVLSAKLNQHPVDQSHGWYDINSAQTLEFDVYLPRPTNDYVDQQTVQARKQTQQLINTIEISEYDHNYISQLNSKFYALVDRLISHPDASCILPDHTAPIPYAHQVRVQSQLVNNIDLIKDKNVVDFGCDRGQFTYPASVFGAKSITGAQIIVEHNQAIVNACRQLKINNVCAVECDLYNLEQVKQTLVGVDTILFLGIIYHINHHYQLFNEFSNSSAKAIIIDSKVDDMNFYMDPVPGMYWVEELQMKNGSGIESNSVNPKTTWVGIPNLAWICNTLTKFGWQVRSSVTTCSLAFNYPQLRHHGVITAVKN